MLIILSIILMGDKMRRRSCDYFYKSCDIEKMSPLDKKRYELLNEFGYNFDSSKKRHKNSESR